jgi:D-glycero-alpha-D-manno-heptose-7-phosphate kinase
MGFAINKYCYISIRPLPPFFEHRHRIVYSIVENVSEIKEIKHPAVRAVLQDQKIDIGLEIHHDGDLPARSGLGSSSSFTVGMLNSLCALRGGMIDKSLLAREAIRIEQEVIGEAVGSQDQIWAAFGGINRIDFSIAGDFQVRPLIMPSERRQELFDHLLLFFTGFSRFASEIAQRKIDNFNKRQEHIKTMTSLVDEALDIIQSKTTSIGLIGDLLNQSWQLKRELADTVTTPEIDEIYEAALDSGARGGKLLGAGGGGFFLLFVEPKKQLAVKERLKNLVQVDFGIDEVGSKIVLYEPAGLENR